MDDYQGVRIARDGTRFRIWRGGVDSGGRRRDALGILPLSIPNREIREISDLNSKCSCFTRDDYR